MQIILLNICELAYFVLCYKSFKVSLYTVCDSFSAEINII